MSFEQTWYGLVDQIRQTINEVQTFIDVCEISGEIDLTVRHNKMYRAAYIVRVHRPLTLIESAQLADIMTQCLTQNGGFGNISAKLEGNGDEAIREIVLQISHKF